MAETAIKDPSSVLPRNWTETQFRELAAGALHVAPSEDIFHPPNSGLIGNGDFDLNPHMAAELDLEKPLRPAAVLVPIILREQLTVLLTERSAHLPNHAGQVAFPGGKIEKHDPDPLGAALRESEEEIGLDRSFVEPFGYLDNYRTGTGFHVTPIVGLVKPEFTLKLDPSEVESSFEVPLEFLMSSGNHQQQTKELRGRKRVYYAMPYRERYIWGATAGMIKNLHDRIFQS